MTGNHAGQVIGQIVMRGNAGAIADPDAGQRAARAEIDVIVLTETR